MNTEQKWRIFPRIPTLSPSSSVFIMASTFPDFQVHFVSKTLNSKGCFIAGGNTVSQHHRGRHRLAVVPAPLLRLRLRLIWGKWTVGVRDVGP